MAARSSGVNTIRSMGSSKEDAATTTDPAVTSLNAEATAKAGLTKEEFIVLRDDPNDVYKPSTTTEVIKLAEHHHPKRQIIQPEDEELLQKIAEDTDRAMSLEVVVPSQVIDFELTAEEKEELERLPSWLQSAVWNKYPLIKESYEGNVAGLLRALANRIQLKYIPSNRFRGAGSAIFAARGSENERDYRDFSRLSNTIKQEEDALAALSAKRQSTNTIAAANVTESTIALRVAYADERWKGSPAPKVTKKQTEKSKTKQATPGPTVAPIPMRILSQRESIQLAEANVKLRTALQVRASYGQVKNWEEDEDLLVLHQRTMDSDEEENFKQSYKYNSDKYWNEIFDEQELRTLANRKAEEYFRSKEEKKDAKVLKRKMKRARKTHLTKEEKKMQIFTDKKKERFFASKSWKRTKKRAFLSHGYFQKDERLFRSSCGTLSRSVGISNAQLSSRTIAVALHNQRRKKPMRKDRISRCDESFHTYCMALVTWVWFKVLIMGIIAVNAILLAIEAGPLGDSHPFYFELIDSVFVAVYTVEFLLKVYAHPFLFWQSGFNVFDFTILAFSLGKAILDWADIVETNWLRALRIARVLRILRCITLSVQLQVLLSALVETIKSHVLSVVILLILLLYVTAIVAFYLFGSRYPAAFGTVGRGMLNMLRVLTIDGWTDLNLTLQELFGTAGTLFMIICIVLGNFLFSNIFVAIIIMNISEATDKFREKQKQQRETIVRQKKEKFFHRQKLDLRLLYFKQRVSAFRDFFSLSTAFQNLLRHDDLVEKLDIISSPLWVDNLYQSAVKSQQTSTVLMNLHRELTDNLLELYRENKKSKMDIKPISRATYNRYLHLKSKLGLIKNEIMSMRTHDETDPKTK